MLQDGFGPEASICCVCMLESVSNRERRVRSTLMKRPCPYLKQSLFADSFDPQDPWWLSNLVYNNFNYSAAVVEQIIVIYLIEN